MVWVIAFPSSLRDMSTNSDDGNHGSAPMAHRHAAADVAQLHTGLSAARVRDEPAAAGRFRDLARRIHRDDSAVERAGAPVAVQHVGHPNRLGTQQAVASAPSYGEQAARRADRLQVRRPRHRRQADRAGLAAAAVRRPQACRPGSHPVLLRPRRRGRRPTGRPARQRLRDDPAQRHVAPARLTRAPRQTCASPPSTNSSLPVMKLLASEARKATVAAISLGSATLFMTTPSAICANSADSPPAGASPTNPGVSTGPGTSVLTRMPRSASSTAIVRPSDRTAAFDAAYRPNAGVPFDAAVEPARMTDAPRLSNGRNFCTVNRVPPTLRLKVSR